MANARDRLLTDLLRDVSRSFYLTLRVLPGSIRSQIGLAYLLARTTDTIADTELVPVSLRLSSLEALRDRILGRTSSPLHLGELAGQQGSASESLLLRKIEDSLSFLAACSSEDQKLIRQVLDTITSGQSLDLQRFAGASLSDIRSLRTAEELDDYTYRVAGCVGEFWTKMCLAHAFSPQSLKPGQPSSTAESFETQGIRFGKGLQLVNILRDIPADLKNGRCYLPHDQLVAAGLSPSDLRVPENEPRFRPVYNQWLDRAQDHLLAGWDYTNRIPRRQIRIRLACAWPILIGLQTIRLLRVGNVLDSGQRIKIRRADVRSVVLRSVAFYPLSAVWRKMAYRN